MAYSKTEWTEATPITAVALNKLEQGLSDVDKLANSKLGLAGGTLTGGLTATAYAIDSKGDYAEMNGRINGVRRFYLRGLKDGGAELHAYNSNGDWWSVIQMGNNKVTMGNVEAASFIQTPAQYGIPTEIGQYIDMHRVGTNSDYSTRLEAMDGGKLNVSNKRVATFTSGTPAHDTIYYGTEAGRPGTGIQFCW